MPSKKNKFLAVTLVVAAVFVCGLLVFWGYRNTRQQGTSVNPVPPQPQRSQDKKISEGYPWGHDLSSIATSSIGEPAYIGDYVHMGLFSREGTEQVIQLSDITGGSAQAGGKVVLKGTVYNPEIYPLVDLQLFGILYEENALKDARTNIKADFLVLPDLALKPQEKREFQYELQLPKELANKKHVVALGLNQGRVWSYGINPYHGRINKYWHNSKSIASFDVTGGDDSQLVIERDAITIESQGNKFFVRGKETVISSPEIKVNFDLINNSQQDKDVTVIYSLVNLAGEQFSEYQYPEWTGLMPQDRLFIKGRERATIDRVLNLDEIQEKVWAFEKEKNLSWKENSRSFSTLKVEVATAGGESIFYAPMFLEYQGYVACPLFPQISKFPIKKGDSFDVVTGFYDYRQSVFDFRDGRIQVGQPIEDRFQNEPKIIGELKNPGKIEVILYNERNKEIGRLFYDGLFDGHKKAWKNTIQAQEDLNYVKLVGNIYDENNGLNKTFERVYDCNKIGDEVCLSQKNNNGLWGMIILLILLGFLASLLIYQVKRIGSRRIS